MENDAFAKTGSGQTNMMRVTKQQERKGKSAVFSPFRTASAGEEDSIPGNPCAILCRFLLHKNAFFLLSAFPMFVLSLSW